MCWIVNIAMVPSMYMLLTIYAFFNMDDVSWGTRETPKTEAEKRAEAEAAAKAPKKQKKGIRGLIERMSLGNFKLSTVFHKESDKALSDKLDRIEKMLVANNNQSGTRDEHQVTEVNGVLYETKNIQTEKDLEKDSAKEVQTDVSSIEKEEKDQWDGSVELIKQRGVSAIEQVWKGKNFWFGKCKENEERCKILNDAKEEELNEVETNFWKHLIEQYLYPLDANKEAQKKEKQALTEFKTTISLGFILINAILVTIIFMLQFNMDLLGMKWPLEKKGPILTFDTEDVEHSNQVTLTYDYLKLDPIGLLFILLLMGTITLLTIGMFFHRVVTLEQIVADVSIRSKKKDELVERPIDILQEMREEFRGDNNKLRGRGMDEKVKNYLQDNQKI